MRNCCNRAMTYTGIANAVVVAVLAIVAGAGFMQGAAWTAGYVHHADETDWLDPNLL